MTSKAIEPAKTEITEYKLAVDMEKLPDLIVSNVGEKGLSVDRLERIVNPKAGATKWGIPTLEGDPEETSEIEGIIVFHKLSRARWSGAYNPGNTEPPLCSSKNGFTGEGDPGGKCSDCPYGKFTEDKKGDSVKPECRVVKQVFIRFPNELLPTVLNITAINIGNAESYLFKLLNKNRKFNSVVTKINLTADTSKSGYDYAKTNFAATALLSPDQAAEMDEYTEMIKPMLLEIEMTADDVKEPDW